MGEMLKNNFVQWAVKKIPPNSPSCRTILVEFSFYLYNM